MRAPWPTTGYVMPANLDVVNSDDFLQPGQRPLHADVFAREVRDTRLLPERAALAAGDGDRRRGS